MASYNLIVLMGNLTRDVKLSYTPNQVEVADFGIAVNKKFKSSNGEQKESVLFIDCVAFKKNAVNLNKFVSKGDPIFLTGELQHDTWKAKDGTKRSKHRVIVEKFQFLGGKTEPKQGNENYQSSEDEIPF